MTKKEKSNSVAVGTNLKRLAGNLTTLHGTNQFTNKSGIGLFLWTIVLAANVVLTVCFIVIAKHKYDDDAMYTQINPNCNVSQVPFPAVSVCNLNLVSEKETADIEKLLESEGFHQEDIDGFFHALPYLKDYQAKSTQIGNFSQIMSLLKYHHYSMDSMMAEVHQKCENLLVYCTFNRKVKNCSEIFHLIKTYQGHCCTFNYGGVNDASDNPFTAEDDDFEYYDDDEDDTGPMFRKLIATTEFGRFSGLLVIFNVQPEDYPPYSIAPFHGAQVLVNDAYDYPETVVLYQFIAPGESVDLKVEPKIFKVESTLRKIAPSKRNCWFHDEVYLGHTDRYSFETCNTECKMQTFMDSCGCIPYKYPKEKTKRFCEFEDLQCLNNITVSLSKEEMNCNPHCYVECADKKYSMISDVNTILSEDIPAQIAVLFPVASKAIASKPGVSLDHDPGIEKKYKVESLSAVHVYYGQFSCNCYELALLIDINYFIATYGGVFSLSFGGSLLTVAEILYLILSFIVARVVNLYNRVFFQ